MTRNEMEVREMLNIANICISKKNYIKENLMMYGKNTTLKEIIDELDRQIDKYNGIVGVIFEKLEPKPTKDSHIEYVEYSPNDFVYEKLREFTLLVYFNGDVYRKDNIKLGTPITKDLVLSVIKDDNRTHITDFNEDLKEYVENVKNRKCGDRILSDIKTL